MSIFLPIFLTSLFTWGDYLFEIRFNIVNDNEDKEEVLRQVSGAVRTGVFIIWMLNFMV